MSTSRHTPVRSASEAPFYRAVGNEVEVFRAAARRGLPVLLKGPTGCGKTRFVEAMAHELGRDLITVAGHEDMTSADLVGRFLLKGGETVWVDGPLTRAVREGAICYLDEVVEARQDTTVVIHPLADHRRELPVDRLGTTVQAAPGFQLVISYNPGYQSVLKNIKESTRQRFVAIELDFQPAEIETEVVAHEAGVDIETARALVKVGDAIRNLDGAPLREVASTRMLILAGGLVAEGLSLRSAVQSAVVQVLSDDPDVSPRPRRTRRRRPAPAVTASDSGSPDRFRFLATFLAGRSLGVTEAPAGEAAHTDGRFVFVSAGRSVSEQRREVLVQSALLGAGSLDHAVGQGVAGDVRRWRAATWRSKVAGCSPSSPREFRWRPRSAPTGSRPPRPPTSRSRWPGAGARSPTRRSGSASSDPPGCWVRPPAGPSAGQRRRSPFEIRPDRRPRGARRRGRGAGRGEQDPQAVREPAFQLERPRGLLPQAARQVPFPR